MSEFRWRGMDQSDGNAREENCQLDPINRIPKKEMDHERRSLRKEFDWNPGIEFLL